MGLRSQYSIELLLAGSLFMLLVSVLMIKALETYAKIRYQWLLWQRKELQTKVQTKIFEICEQDPGTIRKITIPFPVKVLDCWGREIEVAAGVRKIYRDWNRIWVK